MRPGDRAQYYDDDGSVRYDDGPARRSAEEPRRDAVGPQGAALILELERLRHAFDDEARNDGATRQPPRTARDGLRPPPPGRQRTRQPKRRQKGKMERVIEVCLEQLGFSTAPPVGRRSENAREPSVTLRSPRTRPGGVTLDASISMEKPEREIPGFGNKHRSTPINKPRRAPPPNAREPSVTLSPPRPRPDAVTLDGSIPIDLLKPGREMPGFGNKHRSMPTNKPRQAPPPNAREPSVTLPRQRPDAVTLDGSIPMDLLKSGREIPGLDNKQAPINKPGVAIPQSMPTHKPRLALPRPAGNIEPTTGLGQLVKRGRVGVAAGVAFLVNRDALAHNDNAPGDSLTLRTGRAYEHELRTGLRVLIAAIVLAGGWMALMPLAAAVVVPGNLVVQSNVKTIQHPTGGVVAEIPVNNGMRVSVGDLLLRLDATQAQASLQMVSKQLDEARARIARLIAERDGLPRPEIPPEMAGRLDEIAIKNLLASEETQFKARANARYSQKDLLQSRIAQLGEEIAGLEAQVASKAKQLELIAGELSGVQDLYDKRLVPLTRLTTLQRETARIEGERGQLTSTIAETKSKVGEAQLQIVKLDQDFRTDVVKELGETQGKEAELEQRGVAARDLLDRIELRAPTSGIIHQLSTHTIGGVIRAGDAIMEVVPDSDDLQIEARLQPNDIDQVRVGQKALIRFSAFNQRVTPQLVGLVSYVSADVSHDQQTNSTYFTVRMTLPEDERRRLAGLQLVSGMPAEVFMQTGSRTMMSYLLKPITDQFNRAFVER
jgi:HlyD family secretion protein